ARGTPEAHAALRRALAASHVRVKIDASGPVERAWLSRDGTRILTGGGRLELWDAASGRRLARVPGFDGSFSADGRRAVAVADTAVRVLDARTGARTLVLRAPDRPSAAALSRDGRYVAAASGGRLRVWNADTARPR